MSELGDFLDSLPGLPDEDLCIPPGLGGLWKVRHIRAGLDQGVLVVHRSGWGFAFAPFPSKHGACQNCAQRRSICDHCNCHACVWDRMASDHGGPRVTQAQTTRLRAMIRALQLGPRPKPVYALDEDL